MAGLGPLHDESGIPCAVHSARVKVGPPLSANGASRGSVLSRSALEKHVASLLRLRPLSLIAEPAQFWPGVLFATIVLVSIAVPELL